MPSLALAAIVDPSGLNATPAGPATADEAAAVYATEVSDLPAWVQANMAPAAEPQFKVDEYIRSLGYRPTVRFEDLPSWLQKYLTPPESPQFKVDQFIESLS